MYICMYFVSYLDREVRDGGVLDGGDPDVPACGRDEEPSGGA